jgi:predicted DNA-binding transcriptional regulator AlpA
VNRALRCANADCVNRAQAANMNRKEPPIGTNGGAPLEQLITVAEVADFVRVSIATVWRRVADGSFPPPIYPSACCPRWRPKEIHEALESKRAMPREAMAGRRAARIARAAGQSPYLQTSPTAALK